MKKILKIVTVLVLAFLLYFSYTTYPKLDLISGFSAKSIASGHFIDGRSLSTIESGDNDIAMITMAKNELNDLDKIGIASVYGMKKRKAIYREGLGATLLDDDFDVTKPYLIPQRDFTKINLPYPFGNNDLVDTIFSEIDYKKLKAAVGNVFDHKGEIKNRTRAVVVLYKNRLIAEQYSDGFTKDSKILGWSMTKSLTATYFGILQKQGKININQSHLYPQWENDSRKNITINNLLHMNSGLEWEEDYTKISDVTKMLFLTKNMTQIQVEKPQLGEPNKSWNYSSGTSNMLSGILRKQFKTHQEYLDFWYSSLIDKIGMHSMLVETDMDGNFVGSSYAWATARDWAKFGLLYLNKGHWNGEQIFDESWSKYVATPTPTSNGIYGGHFWLNAEGQMPDVPKDMYSCNGYQGQRVYIIPSKDLVIVRMGLKEGPDFDFNGFVKGILESFKQ